VRMLNKLRSTNTSKNTIQCSATKSASCEFEAKVDI
jgi:hypothetical protein